MMPFIGVFINMLTIIFFGIYAPIDGGMFFEDSAIYDAAFAMAQALGTIN